MSTMASLHFETLRQEMVDRQIAARGVRDRRVLEALGTVPREAFLPERLAEFAYDDTPLPIGQEQTISQPYVVALMAEALELQPGDKVLEIGAGSGYAAAVLSRIAREVWTVERHESLAREARERMARLGYANVHVIHGDGTLGWPEHAPYDAIVVAAGGPEVPQALLDQLAPGGRLVIPIGPEPRTQSLVRVRRRPDGTHAREDLGGVRFVPLIGAQGWREEGGGLAPPPQAPVVGVGGGPGEPVTENPAAEAARAAEAAAGVRPVFGELAPAGPPPEIVLMQPRQASPVPQVAKLIREEAEPFGDIETADLGALLERIGDSRVVLLGEATHGTSEFYRFRARLTRELIVQKGFNLVAVEADWPDAARIDRYVRDRPGPPAEGPTFSRFPTWMWRNREVRDFTHWLREHNAGVREPGRRVSFHGLDVYSLYTSIAAVLRYLQGIDPEAAQVARLRYGCLTPWERDPALYGRAALTRRFPLCEAEVLTTLQGMLEKRLEYVGRDGESYIDAVQNARIVANAERYYRAMYYGSAESWNLRDRHMFDTLLMLLNFRSREGREAKAVVWEHNSHIGNAGATEMGARGELNVGQLARDHFGDAAYLIGFGTDHGTVAAATDWDGEMEIKRVRPSHPESYERLCHESGVPAFLLHLREPRRAELREELEVPRLERAIGVIYRPETELLSHYFQAVLPWQFDEYVWFDETRAVTPLGTEEVSGMPETYPFGL
ncbi:MAG TPA: protein-L-isoaspartate(D-aspartate) O-methyltransferase [Thermoanaerobaculia bacterium]|nr:protein-L-isoaspartate(D-aspartate) O-methyltransferase [Thermoanaerobaculia bacterium]